MPDTTQPKKKPASTGEQRHEKPGERHQGMTHENLQGMTPEMSEAERANRRPTRDDGDNDDEGELK